jgi:uncharacterized cupin superfamily protein
LQNVTKLNGDNWHTLKSQIMKVLVSIEADDIVSGEEPKPAASDKTDVRDWKTRNKKAGTIMWSCTEPEWQYLYDDEPFGSVVFGKLKAKFEASNFSRRVALRKAFYGAKHDPTVPIDIFIQNVIHAKAQLVALGITVDDQAVKDVILMNLDESCSGVKTSLLTQPTEPTIDTICSILTAASNIVHPDIPLPIKLEPIDTALVARGRNGGNNPSHGHSFGADGILKGTEGKKDDHGFRWCDPTHENHCHCCGRTGHIAACCVSDMPAEIKAWVLNRPGKASKDEQSMYVHHIPSNRPHSPNIYSNFDNSRN